MRKLILILMAILSLSSCSTVGVLTTEDHTEAYTIPVKEQAGAIGRMSKLDYEYAFGR